MIATGLIPVYLDIETVPTQNAKLREYIAQGVKPPGNMKKAETIEKWEIEAKPEAIEQAVLRTSFDGAFGESIVASFAVADREPFVFSRGPDSTIEDERIMLADFFNAMQAEIPEGMHLSTLVVGHDVARFDLGFLLKRAVILRLPIPRWLPWGEPAWSTRIFDTMHRWVGVDKGERVSLDKLCTVLDVPVKGTELTGDDEIDGAKVYGFWRAGRIEDLRAYCEWDVRRARWVYKLMEGVWQK